MMLKRLHVNQHAIKANAKDGGARPVLSIKTYKGNHKADYARIEGPSTLVYSPEKPLSCGARVWIETEAPVYYHAPWTPERGPVDGYLP